MGLRFVGEKASVKTIMLHRKFVLDPFYEYLLYSNHMLYKTVPSIFHVYIFRCITI